MYKKINLLSIALSATLTLDTLSSSQATTNYLPAGGQIITVTRSNGNTETYSVDKSNNLIMKNGKTWNIPNASNISTDLVTFLNTHGLKNFTTPQGFSATQPTPTSTSNLPKTPVQQNTSSVDPLQEAMDNIKAAEVILNNPNASTKDKAIAKQLFLEAETQTNILTAEAILKDPSKSAADKQLAQSLLDELKGKAAIPNSPRSTSTLSAADQKVTNQLEASTIQSTVLKPLINDGKTTTVYNAKTGKALATALNNAQQATTQAYASGSAQDLAKAHAAAQEALDAHNAHIQGAINQQAKKGATAANTAAKNALNQSRARAK